ncbi:MAG: hypothetical protein ACXWZP_07005 [Gaiellaceae bacterium]
MKFSPQLHDRLVHAVRSMDVERMSIADAWRLAGGEAERLGLCRPGYHSVLARVLDERERRIARREAILGAVDELWAFTGPDISGLIDRLSETRRQ